MNQDFAVSLLQYIDDIVSPDPLVQQRVADQFRFLHADGETCSAALRTLLSFLMNGSFSARQRQTSALLFKRLVASSSSADLVASIILETQDSLLLALADDAPLVQTAVSMVFSTVLGVLTLTRWSTLLERISLFAAAGVEQRNVQYLLGVSRCLHIIFEDCSGEIAALCEDPLQLSALCEILESCLSTVIVKPQATHPLSAADEPLVAALLPRCVVVWRACESLFSSGIVPQSEHVWSSSGFGGQFGFAETDDDSSDDGDRVGLVVKGNSPHKTPSGGTRLSRGQRKIRREQVLKRLRFFVDRVVDSMRSCALLVTFGDTLQHPSISCIMSSAELTIVNLATQLIGFWERSGSFVAELFPQLLGALQRSNAAPNNTPTHIAIVDFITELAQDHNAHSVVESNLAGIVQGLLSMSLLTKVELDSLLEGEDNSHIPDDEHRVLLSLTRRGVSLMSSSKRHGGEDSGEELPSDEGDVMDAVMDESEGTTRDAVAWCWNCLAVSFPEELTTALIPVLVNAAMSAIASEQPLVFEAVLYTLSELIDELFAHIPPEVMNAFLHQCECVLRGDAVLGGDGSARGALSSMHQWAAIRRQSLCCLERAAVGCLTSVDVDADDHDDGGDISHVEVPTVDADYVLRILLAFIRDRNKKVQLAAIKGVENILVHALKADGNEGEDDEDISTTAPKEEEERVSADELLAFYSTFVLCMTELPLQLRSHVGLCQALGRIVEADAESAHRIFFRGDGGADALLKRGPPCISIDVFESLISFVHASLCNATTTLHLSVAAVLSALSALCDCLEQSDAQTLLRPMPNSSSVVLRVWELVGAIIVSLTQPRLQLQGDFVVFRDELLAISMDCVSATCDVFSGLSEQDVADGANIIPRAFLSTSIASSALTLLRPETQAEGASVEANLRRACFGVLGDFVTCGAAHQCASFCSNDIQTAVLDGMLRACLQEAVIFPAAAAGSSSALAERWGAMDARSNALYCLSHLLRLCNGDQRRLLAIFPTFACDPECQTTAVQSLLQQLDSTATNNIHRTMKLNILLALSCMAPMIADHVLCVFGVAAVSGLLYNASYYLHTADDPDEVLAVLEGIGSFLRHAVLKAQDLVMSVLTADNGTAAVARLTVMFSKKGVASHNSNPSNCQLGAQGILHLWRDIAVSVLRGRPISADPLRITKKEAAWLQKFIQ